jgi:arylsulfatase A
MNRRTFLAGLSAIPMAAQSKRPPNIVLILADDLGAKELGCYGNTKHRTPNLDRMAAEGVRFETCYATPLCSPSRVLLMTGRYGFRTGFTNFIGRETTRLDRVSADEITFADVLKTRGYRTGLAGKWQLGLIQKHPTMIHDSGFDRYFTWVWQKGGLPPNTPHEGKERNRYWDPAIIEDGKYVPTKAKDYGPELYSDWIVRFMQEKSEQPFLAYYTEPLTHEPWDPTPDDPSGGLKANVEYLDKVVGKVLRAAGDNTIVIFTGDNGTGKDGKATVTELGVRVPLIVRGPGIRKGYVSRELVDFSDMMPTLAEFAGARLPDVPLDGTSFVPELQGRPGKKREWIFSYLTYGRMLRDKRWLLEGDGKFYDCGEARDGKGYKDVTDSQDPEVVSARARFDTILAKLPAPPLEQPGGARPGPTGNASRPNRN